MIRPLEVTRVDDEKVMAFVHRAVGEFGVTLSAALTVIGDKLGLYKALWAAGPLTSEELARQTGTVEAYVRPWLVNQAAGGVLTYDGETGKYSSRRSTRWRWRTTRARISCWAATSS